ncbi:MAG: hypothetical protein C0399_07595 [Syntrophus sp. (in: bacteria)]|nr:hypothetical protein [Syntrophus sp. (in: bacteria)]
MRRLNLVLLAILINLSMAVFTAVPTIAWWHGKGENHKALAELSKDEIANKFKDINAEERKTALAIGADKPDIDKKITTTDHEKKIRVSQTLCAAVNAKNRKDALMRLVIGFHYLADNGDVTESWQKDTFRYIACKMLLGNACNAKPNNDADKFMQEFEKSGEYIKDWKNGIEWKVISSYWDEEMKKVKNSDGLVDNLRNMAKTRHEMLRKAHTEHNYFLLRLSFLEAFACIKAAQDRLTTFYTEELINVTMGGKCGESVDRRSINCSTTTKSGGDEPAKIHVNVGLNPGTAVFSYEMYDVKDRMIVVYGGQTLYDTGCTNGSKSIPLHLSGKSDQVIIFVKPACEKSGTQWNFTLECPK